MAKSLWKCLSILFFSIFFFTSFSFSSFSREYYKGVANTQLIFTTLCLSVSHFITHSLADPYNEALTNSFSEFDGKKARILKRHSKNHLRAGNNLGHIKGHLNNTVLQDQEENPLFDLHPIVEGEPAYETFMIMMLDERQGSYFRGPCGAVLIGKKWALTAGHCISNIFQNDLLDKMDAAYIGPDHPWEEDENGRKNNGSFFQIVSVKNHYEHVLHEPGGSRNNDLALLELAEEVDDFWTPLALADETYMSHLPEGIELQTFGMGRITEGGPSSQNLQKVSVPYVLTQKCKDDFDRPIDETMLCAGGDGMGDSCSGDSGGPIIHNHVLVGIVSWGIGCNREGLPGVYSKISSQLDWIKGFEIPDLQIESEISDSSSSFNIYKPKVDKYIKNITCETIKKKKWCKKRVKSDGKIRVRDLCPNKCAEMNT